MDEPAGRVGSVCALFGPTVIPLLLLLLIEDSAWLLPFPAALQESSQLSSSTQKLQRKIMEIMGYGEC